MFLKTTKCLTSVSVNYEIHIIGVYTLCIIFKCIVEQLPHLIPVIYCIFIQLIKTPL